MRRFTPRGRAVAAAAALGVAATLLPARPLRAQNGPTAQQRRAAAEAYDRGTSAWLAEAYARAARFFETAHGLAPTSQALIEAVRAHDRAGHARRAATLALRLQANYADHERAQRIAEDVLERARERFTRVDVACDGCTLEANGKILGHPSFFVRPGEPHQVTASFSTGERRRKVQGKAGERIELELEAPPAPPAGAGGEPASSEGGSPDAQGASAPRGEGADPSTGDGGLSPWVATAAIGATAGLGAATLWSGLDTLAGVDEYEANPTRARLEAGQRKERRTNILIGATAAAGVAALALTVFTDWKAWGGEQRTGQSVGASVRPLPGGAAGIIEGRF